MDVIATTDAPTATGADTIVVGVFEDEGIAHDHDGVLQALVDSGEAKRGLRKLAVTHAGGRRYIVAGLGGRSEFDPERARVAAAGVVGRAKELGTRDALLGGPPPRLRRARGRAGRGHAAGRLRVPRVQERVRRRRRGPARSSCPPHHDVVRAPLRAAALVAGAVNAARNLQNRPANDLTPEALAARAGELEGVTVDVLDRAGIEAAGMGAFACVAQGSHVEPRLITIRYDPADVTGPLLGFVGKAVTFDSGGISIKPAAKMHEMKFDMSGGAAVLEAVGAIAALRPAGARRGRDRRDREPAVAAARSSPATSCAPSPA